MRLQAVSVVMAISAACVAFRMLMWGGLEHTSLVFIGIPILLSVIVALSPSPRSATGTILKVVTLSLLIAWIAFAEAFVCILFAAPLFFLIGAGIGALDSAWIAGASGMTIAYGMGLAGWHEDKQLVARFGDAWIEYRRQVPRWRPRWRPFTSSHARLYVAESCSMCSTVGAWLTARGVIGLDIVPAESHPTRELERLTYEPAGDARPDEGVAAFARALEHINLGWACLGMFIRLPLIRPFLQLLVDASGGEKRRVVISRHHSTDKNGTFSLTTRNRSSAR